MVNKPRKARRRGVAMLIREDVYHQAETMEDLEDPDQKILWIKVNNAITKLYIGIFNHYIL